MKGYPSISSIFFATDHVIYKFDSCIGDDAISLKEENASGRERMVLLI